MAAVTETAQATGCSLQAGGGCIEGSGGQHVPSSRTPCAESWPAPTPPSAGRDEAGAGEDRMTRAGRHESRDLQYFEEKDAGKERRQRQCGCGRES